MRVYYFILSFVKDNLDENKRIILNHYSNLPTDKKVLFAMS